MLYGYNVDAADVMVSGCVYHDSCCDIQPWARVAHLYYQFSADPQPKSTGSFVGCGLAPEPTEGAYSTPPDPLAVFRGPTSKKRVG